VTSSAANVTNSDRPHWADRLGAFASPRRVFAIWAVCVLLTGLVNALSVGSDLAKRGIAFHSAEPWIWEMSSAIALVLLGVPLAMLDGLLRSKIPRVGPRAAFYVLGSVAFCVAHVTLMVAFRTLITRALGWRYDFGPWLDGLVYEYRKDALTYALILGCIAVWRAALPAASAPTEAIEPPTARPPEPTFVVRTTKGDVLVRTAEIEWVEAQGNYVALHTPGDLRLLRQTLAEMETRLAPHGFIRTHRRALVALHFIQSIVPPERGEAGVRLASGGLAPLSESRRADVMRQIAGE
jgi:hypothetical protein